MTRILFAVEEEKIKIQDRPVWEYRPVDSTKNGAVVFYHGWSSSAELNRFRAQIIASYGYRVLLPEAMHHGERGVIDYHDPVTRASRFFPVIDASTKEFADLQAHLTDCGINKIMVTGHSMGGYTTASVFAQYPQITAAAVINGSFHFEPIVKYIETVLSKEDLEAVRDSHIHFGSDPAKEIDALVNRPILMVNGGADPVILPSWQRVFYKQITPLYDDQERIRFVEYEHLGHFVTTNIMEEVVRWADRWIGGTE